jgi:acyl-CoA synthetase (AMP-forming)/AMP-acid ligase II
MVWQTSPNESDLPAMRVDQLLQEVIHVHGRGRAIALRCDDGLPLTYSDLDARVSAVAASLRTLGLRRGQRVVLVGEGGADVVVLLLAAIRAGACAVPLSARMSISEILTICAHCEPQLIYFSTKMSADAASHAACRPGDPASERVFEDGLLAVAQASEWCTDDACDSAQDVAIMIYTSGTTGDPKGVMLSHANLEFVTGVSLQQEVLLPSDKIFHALPLAHSYGLISALLCGLRAGAEILLLARFSAERLARALLHEEITVFQGVPAMYARLFEWASETGTTLKPNRLRMLYIGGSQIDATRKAQAEDLLGVPLHHGYGLTESAPAATRTFGHPPPTDVTAGWPIPGVQVSLRDALGRSVPQGERGEIWIRGPNVMKGYFRDPAQTRQAIDPDGWLHSGDVGVFGPQGDLSVVGRIKEMIICGGFNVFPAEVEKVIATWPDVAQCAVVGQARAGDEEVVAFVEPMAGRVVDVPALQRHLRQRLTPYKLPKRIEVLDRLPASSTGKILKTALKQRAPGKEGDPVAVPTDPGERFYVVGERSDHNPQFTEGWSRSNRGDSDEPSRAR